MFKNHHTRHCLRTSLLVCALTGLVILSFQAQTSSQSGTSDEVQKFYDIIRVEIDRDDQGRTAMAYLRNLSLQKQSNIAHSIINDPDARIAYMGANWLITHGKISEAIPALASIIASGRDQTQLKGRLGYDWVHGDEESFLKVVINLSQYLLERLDHFKGEDRGRVEHFLIGGLFKPPTEPFSIDTAKRRIAELEAALRKLKRAAR